MRIRPLDFDQEWRRAHPFPWGRVEAINPFICHFGTSEHTTTETQNKDPWAPQQPYLTAGFNQAGDLLSQPAPQQQNPVAGFNPAQIAALMGIGSTAANGTPIPGAATGFGTNLLNGSYLNSNPGNGYFSSLAGTNLGLNGPGSSALAAAAAGNGAGSDTLKKYASGGYFSNAYSDDAAKSIMADVVPQITAQFNRGGAINNPLAARSAAEGATAALAPLEFQNQLQQEQLQQQAAQTLGANQLAGASGANSSAISGGSLQATGATGLSGNYQDTIAKMVQGLALAPQTQGLSYSDLQQLFGAGSAAQNQQQNEESGQAATYNFSQMSPYQQLAAYMQAVTGNYGGTSTDTKPYYTNDTANTLGTVSSIASLGATLIPFL